MKIKELLEKRMNLVSQARALVDLAEKEKRDMTAAETEQFNKIMGEVESLKSQITRQETLEREERDAQNSANASVGVAVGTTRADHADDKHATSAAPKVIQLRSSPMGDPRDVVIQGPTGNDEYGQHFRNYLQAGTIHRALQMDKDSAGGYVVAPMQFVAELIQAVDNICWMRQLARLLPPLTQAASLGAPSLDNDPADPTWTAELAIGSEDSTMSFGKRELKPWPLAQFLKVSKTLLRMGAINVDALVRQRLAYKIAVVLENAYLNGTGVQGPLGVFTASSLGISTGRDVSTGNTTSSITFDGLMSAEYALKVQYRSKASWLFHRDAMLQISKLKDGNGVYLWQPSVVQNQPDRIRQKNVYESEYAPNTFTTGCYVGMLADWSNYWIVDSLAMSIQVLQELYAATNQNGYISRFEGDGMPILEESFVRVKLA